MLKRFVTRGITAVRDVGGPVDVLQTLRQRCEKGELIGPELFYSPHAGEEPVTWAQRNIALLRLHRGGGLRLGRGTLAARTAAWWAWLPPTIGNFDRDVYQHLVATAGKLSLPVTYDPGPPFFHAIPWTWRSPAA
ncbi:MAG: hypothetical protein U1E76_19260 [Planctomycetota bacterium]